MTLYTQTLASLRLSALNALQDALNNTTDPAELRRIAQAIFKAPAPDDDIDAAIALDPEQQGDPAPTTEHPSPGPDPSDDSHSTAAPAPRDTDGLNAPRATRATDPTQLTTNSSPHADSADPNQLIRELLQLAADLQTDTGPAP